MGFRMHILFSIILISLTINSYAILDPSEIDGGEGTSLADKLIEESQGPGTNLADSIFPANPWESRKLQENKSVVWEPMPKSLGGISTNVKKSRSPSGDQTKLQNPLAKVAENLVAGSWSFELNNTESKQIVLTLFQIEDAIFGSGSIKDGENTFVAGASGEMNGDKLDLDIISIGTIGLYRLATTFSNDAVSGTFKEYLPDGQISTGNVQSTSFLPISKSTNIPLK